MKDVHPKYVTQEEAAAVIDLWTRMREAGGAGDHLLTVGDVSEALNLPVAEVEILLTKVRNAPVVSLPEKIVKAPQGQWFKLLIASITIAAGFTIAVTQASSIGRVDDDLQYLAFGSAFWVLLWASYFRRPISRFIKRFAAGFADGQA